MYAGLLKDITQPQSAPLFICQICQGGGAEENCLVGIGIGLKVPLAHINCIQCDKCYLWSHMECVECVGPKTKLKKISTIIV